MTDDTQPAKWQLGDIHHIGLTVSDLERSIQFYRDLLGLTLILLALVAAAVASD